MGCVHVDSNTVRLNPPAVSSRVYKDECTLCFDSQDSEQGINVCLSCFEGLCWKNESDHLTLHFSKFKHPYYLNIRRVENPKIPKLDHPEKMTRIEIVQEDESKKYSFETQVLCAQCSFTPVTAPSPEINNVVQGVISAISAKKQSEIQSWQEESLKPCHHTDNLDQCSPMELEGKSLGTCRDCDLKENLWLCLTCGNLGCGRAQYGGIGGNGHALNHYNNTHHPLSVKMGSITPEGTADVFCYKDGEEVIDPLLGKHLANFGINVLSQQKTEKSVAELQLEQNMKFDFSMITEDGKEMTPLFGPGLTGLKNLGNSCYMASILQVVFSVPAFAERYNQTAKDHILECRNPAPECFTCQMFKLANGILSGKYSVARIGDESNSGQDGIAPLMFKSIIGKGHPEFSTMRQQDAQEFLSHFLTVVEQKERITGNDPSKSFQFRTEQRLQCIDCERVAYKSEIANSLIIRVPKADNDNHVSLYELIKSTLEPYFGEYNCSVDKRKTMASFKLRFETFPDVLAITLAKFVVNDRWVWEKLNTRVDLPDTLHLDDFVVDKRPDIEVLFPTSEVLPSPEVDQDALNQLLGMGFPETRCVRALIATGNHGAETAMNWLFEHMDDPDIDAPLKSDTQGHEPAQEDILQLTDMGFSVDQAKKALKETNNHLERAVDWLFSHAGDMDVGGTEEDFYANAPVRPDERRKSYDLFAFVSHKGTSTHCGHYVAYIRKQDRWVLFNDNKVVEVPDIRSHMSDAYICFYRRKT